MSDHSLAAFPVFDATRTTRQALDQNVSVPQPASDPQAHTDRPALYIFAGPSASGKTRLKGDLETLGHSFDRHINAQDIADAMALGAQKADQTDTAPQEPRIIQARANVISAELRRRCMALGQDFSIETDLGTPEDLDLMHQAKAEGFEVRLYFVALDNPTGPSAPHWHTMRQLADAAWAADRTYIFDHSIDGEDCALTAECENGTIILYADPAPDWVTTFFITPLAGSD